MSQSNENATALRVQILYLLNLLIIPGIAFIGIYLLFKEHKNTPNELTRNHVSQSMVASIVAGVLIIGFTLLILIFGSTDDAYTWMWVILYFTCIHASLVLLGVYGLVKAMGAQKIHYPLIAGIAKTLKGYEPQS